jgi:hypothetical protein
MQLFIWIGLAVVGALAYNEINKSDYDSYWTTIVTITAITGGLVCLIALS